MGPERPAVRSTTDKRARGRAEVWVTEDQSSGAADRLQPSCPLFGNDLPRTVGCGYELDAAALAPMTLALVGLAAVVFTALVGVVHTVTERRRLRRTQEQWEERERLLNREP